MAMAPISRPTPRAPALQAPSAPAKKRRAPPANKRLAANKPPAKKPKAAANPPAANRPQAPAQNPGGGLFDAAKKGFDAAKTRVQDGLQKINQHLNPPLSDQERKAAEYMKKMLGPDKLGGADRTFNHQDVDAIVKGLTDRGIKGTIARRVVANQLPQGLDEAGVVRDPDAKPDTAPRKVSSDELKTFERAGAALEGRGAALEKLGLKAVFPGGISEDAISHMLEGRFGLPPGVEIVPANPWPQQGQ